MRYDFGLQVTALAIRSRPFSIGCGAVGHLKDYKRRVTHESYLIHNIVIALAWNPFPPTDKSFWKWLGDLTTDFPGLGIGLTLFGVAFQVSLGDNKPILKKEGVPSRT